VLWGGGGGGVGGVSASEERFKRRSRFPRRKDPKKNRQEVDDRKSGKEGKRLCVSRDSRETERGGVIGMSWNVIPPVVKEVVALEKGKKEPLQRSEG